MHVTPLEAVDILADMARKNRLTAEWKRHLESCVAENGLDRPDMGNGNRKFMRRGYTCPYFNHGEWGCGVHVDHKPYGCLAFNPVESGISDGGSCRSNLNDLEERDSAWAEQESTWNASLKNQYQLDWDKLDIPRALLQLWKYF
jgi:hypothetical protein